MEILPVIMLVTQQSLLLEFEGTMKANGRFVESQRLTAELVQADLFEGITESGMPHTASRTFWGVRSCIKAPLGNWSTTQLGQLHKALRPRASLED